MSHIVSRPLPGEIIGFNRKGKPIHLVAGGDRTATLPTLHELQVRRAELLRQLEDPSYGGDVPTLVAAAEDLGRQIDRVNARARLLQGIDTLAPSAPAWPVPEQRQTMGTRVVESPIWTQFRESGFHGQVAIDLPGNTRALLDNSPGSLGAFQNPVRPTDVPMANADRPLRLADLLDRRGTDSNTVEYVQETTAAGAGDSARETAEGGLKPEATFTFQVVTNAVRTIAHWVNVTRQSAEDNAQLRGYIEGRLGYGLEYRLDSQILSGDGQGANLRGILNTAGVGTYAAPAGEAAVLSIRRAMTLSQQGEYTPDTVVLHPIDWERVELSTDSQGMFRVSPNVANALAPRIWGLNVVATTAIAGTAPDPDGTGPLTATTGRFVVGSFRMGATLWERDGVRVLATDSHSTHFVSNLITLLAEMRASLSVWRPKAFTVGSFAAGSA